MILKQPGLSYKEVENLQKTHSLNELPKPKPETALSLYLSQLKNPLMYILIFAGTTTLFLKDFLDTIVIFLAVFINSILGFFQEYKAQKTLEKLQNLLSPKAKVIRESKTQEIDASLLVPGDIVLLTQGDKIPADGKTLEAVHLSVNEAILTGESLPAEKFKGDRLFATTIATTGRGVMLVENIGKDTEIGKIAQTLQFFQEEPTPLQKKISHLAKFLAILVVLLCFLVFMFGTLSGENLVTMFTTSVAIAVSAIPEGLIVSLTVILAIGMQRIFKRKAIVRKLVSAETLGAVTVIATDKTGTLTQGELKITNHALKDKTLALKTAALANNLEDPIDLALWDFVRSQGIDPELLQEENKRIDELPFSSEEKFMAVKTFDAIYLKGAPEIVLGKCPLPKEEKEKILQKINQFGEKGLRMVGLAIKETSESLHKGNLDNLTWIGLLAASDPVRETVKEAIINCQKAGIKVIVITGDYQKTAEYVLDKLGIPIKNPQEEVIDGNELEKISETELTKKIDKLRLFARVSPHQKLKIVRSLKAKGEIVAVTGDGVNDALALKEADVGIVVEAASDVAKETADIVLLDSNFTTIVAAIEEGRGIFDNIKRVVLYLLSDTFAEISLIVSSLILRLPLPITPAQILWINIIDDGLPNLALTMEPKSKNLLARPPKDPQEPILTSQIKFLIFVISLFSALFSLLTFIYYLKITDNLELARTTSFSLLAVSSLVYVFAARALTKPIFKVNPFKNPGLIFAVLIGFALQFFAVYHPLANAAFKTVPLALNDWALILFQSFLILIAIEITKGVGKNIKGEKWN